METEIREGLELYKTRYQWLFERVQYVLAELNERMKDSREAERPQDGASRIDGSNYRRRDEKIMESHDAACGQRVQELHWLYAQMEVCRWDKRPH
jgi:hypothetical protein